jgi:acetolactate synthase-1/2/3 large subunit
VSRAARRLAEAKRPVLIAGGGVLFTDACDLLVELARRLKAPIVTTQTARGAVSDDDPLSLGDILDKAARTAIQEADLALALGCRFVHFDTGSWSLKVPALIHVESEASYIGADYRTVIGVPADVRPTLEMLCARISQGQARSHWGDRVAALHSQREVEQRFPIVSALRDALPPEAIVVSDVHMTGYRMRRAFRVTAPRRYFASNSYCTLGYALPAALGAKTAFPDRPVVSVSGDGGFVMTCQELATAAQAGLRIAAVVLNDNCFTSIKGGQVRRFGGRCLAVDLRNPDFVALAEAFGLRGVRVSDDAGLGEAVRAALRAETTTVIEMPLAKKY